MSFQVTSSIPSNGYCSLAIAGKYVGATKQPPFSFEPPKNFNYFVGRWQTDGKTLSNFKKIRLSDGKTQLMLSGLVALANKFFLAYQNAVGFQPSKIYAFDPETLKVTGTSPEIQSPTGVRLQASNGMLFACQDTTLVAYDPEFNPQFQIALDQNAFQIPFFAFTSDQIVCTSCNGAVATYDFKGNSTSDTQFFNDHGVNPWIVTTSDNLAVIGFCDTNNGNSYFQSWALKPLAKVGPAYAIANEYTSSAINTTAGVLLAGAKVLSLGTYPAFEPNYTLYTFPKSMKINCELDLIDPQTIVTVDDSIKIWAYTPGVVPSAEGAFTLQTVTPPVVASAAAPWNVMGSFDLSSIVKGGYWSLIGIDAHQHLFLYEQNSQTLYQMILDGSQITLGKSHPFKGELIFVDLFLAGGHLYASVHNNEAYWSWRLNPETLEAEDIQIANAIYPLDDKTFAGIYSAPLSPGFHKNAPDSTLTIYDAANLQVITSFNISAGAANLNKVGETLIGVQSYGPIFTYDRQGKVTAQAQTGYKSSFLNTGAIPVDDNHFLVGIDDNYLQASNVQLWQVNPLQQVTSESYQMGNFDITSISPTPQGTILGGKQGIQYVGPNPNFNAFATVVKDASGNNVAGPCIALPNNQAAVINGENLQLYQIGQVQVESSPAQSWNCTLI